MEKYISKAAVVAEIERRRKEIPKNETDKALRAVYGNEAFVLTELLSFLDTLEVKEVDLAKELDSYFAKFKGLEKNNWNWRMDDINIHAQGVYDFAKHFYSLGIKAQKGE